MGCYVKGSSFELAHRRDATFKDHKGSSLALAHRQDATLKDFLLHLHTEGMLH